MEWISSTEFIEMLKRFPNTRIEATLYVIGAEHEHYSWEYRKESGTFCYQLDGKTKLLTERGFLRKNEGWMCGETYHFCSDECLLAENPGITQKELDNLVADDDSDIYWTEWED